MNFPRFAGSHFTRDHSMMTFDRALMVHDQGMAVPAGKKFRHAELTHDGKTVDSTGAFLIGELERLDMTLNEPLVSVSWGRDIDLREDVSIADEVSSFTLSTYGSAGGLGTGNTVGAGKAWIGKSTDQISNVSLDIAKIPHQLRPWALELKYTILELESAAKIGRPIDQQKYEGLQLKHQMDIDEQVYIGDTSTGDKGMLNLTAVTATNVAAGQAGGTAWMPSTGYPGKSPDEILADINTALTTVWQNSAYAVIPSRILLPPAQFGYISTQKVSLAGNMSILKYIQENNLMTTSGKGKIDILPCKWNNGVVTGGTFGTVDGHDRMMVYTKDKKRLRFPMTLLQRTPVQYDSIYHKCTYFCRLGVVEAVYPETIGYFDLL